MNRHLTARAALCSCALLMLVASAQAQDNPPATTPPATTTDQTATPPDTTPPPATTPAPAPEAATKAFCVKSNWDKWYGSWAWWVYSSAASEKYPHPPVWKWMDNTKENAENALPDDQCAGTPVPPQP